MAALEPSSLIIVHVLMSIFFYRVAPVVGLQALILKGSLGRGFCRRGAQ